MKKEWILERIQARLKEWVDENHWFAFITKEWDAHTCAWFDIDRMLHPERYPLYNQITNKPIDKNQRLIKK